MRDDFLSNEWARHHDAPTRTFNAVIARLAASWARLSAHQFDAPWRPENRGHG